jgi:hypothetical protein
LHAISEKIVISQSSGSPIPAEVKLPKTVFALLQGTVGIIPTLSVALHRIPGIVAIPLE